MKKESIDIYVFEDARLDGAKNKKLREIINKNGTLTDNEMCTRGTEFSMATSEPEEPIPMLHEANVF